MPNYKEKGSGSPAIKIGDTVYFTDAAKQEPGAFTDQHYDRVGGVISQSFTKSPNAVIIGTLTNKVGFFFGTSASFASAAAAEGTVASQKGSLSGSGNYSTAVSYVDGAILNIHPNAFSCSAADVNDILFVYSSGLRTGPY